MTRVQVMTMAKARKKMAVRKQQQAAGKTLRVRGLIMGVTLGAITIVGSAAFWVSWDAQQEVVVEKEEQLMPIRVVEITGGLERVTREEILEII